MGFVLSFLFGILPMFAYAMILYWADRYEKEPAKLLVGTFLWGMIIAAGGAYLINTIFGIGIFLFTNSDIATEIATGSLIAPIIEEILKGFAVLLIYLFSHSEFDSILDGIVYAGIVALGFSATENAYYIYTYGFAENGFYGLLWMVFIRVFLVGWQHVFYTAFTGIGLSISRLSKNKTLKFLAPILGLSVAMLTHSFHNTIGEFLSGISGLILSTIFDWSGWLMMTLFIIWAIYRDKKWMTDYLKNEIDLEVITENQYKTAISAYQQFLVRSKALFNGKFKNTNRFYQLCAELAHKKHQLTNFGDEDGNENKIKSLREEIKNLSNQV